MIGVAFLDVAIGLVLLFLLVSLLVTAANELVEGWLKTRAKELEKGVRELLSSPDDLISRFYRHPQIYALFGGPVPTGSEPHTRLLGRRHPSYIPARNFAIAVLDLAAEGPALEAGPRPAPDTRPLLDRVNAGIASLPDERLRTAVRNAVDLAEGDLDAAVRALERWFDGTMDRVSGRFKRHAQMASLGLGLVLAVMLNVDALEVAKRLSTDQALREAAVAQATARVAASPQGASGDTSAPPSVGQPPVQSAEPRSAFDQARRDVESVGYPIGWPAPQCAVQADGVRPCSGERAMTTLPLMAVG